MRTASFICLLLALMQLGDSADVRLPPSLKEQPTQTIRYFKRASDLTLKCVATGSGELTYEWKKNGTTLDWQGARISRPDPAVGTIVITKAEEADDGYYQCFVTNAYGRAMSLKTRLACAVLDDFAGGSDPMPHPSTQYAADKLACNAPKAIPNATYYWTVVQNVADAEFTRISTNRRIQIDKDGNLYFAWVKPDDAQSGKIYKCNAMNPTADKTSGGSYQTVTVTERGVPQPETPNLLFNSENKIVGLEGKSIKMRCFFSGYPEPTIEWSRTVGGVPPYPRFAITDDTTGASISNLLPSDEGTYVCTGTVANAPMPRNHSMQLTVEAEPKITGEVRDINATNGDTVVIDCPVYAKPAPQYTWYRNSEPLDSHALPAKFSMSVDRTSLTVTNVQKSYPDGSKPAGDLMVIQCVASNAHGYAYKQVYVNVLEKTQIVNRSDDASFSPYETVTFRCVATSDDSTPIRYLWFFNDAKTPIAYDNKTVYFVDNTLYIVTKSDSDGGASRKGTYTCLADNGYSKANATFTLTAVGSFPVVTSSASMWIGLGIGLLLLILLIVLLILAWFYIQRNKGDSYAVDEKERITGNDPEQEIEDSGFHDYQRPASGFGNSAPGYITAGTGTKESLTASLPQVASDDDPSLSAYTDRPDYGKFQEDGSFIGEYNVNTGYRK